MSPLSESLKSITSWIRQNTPGWDLPAGLSYERIQETVKELPFEMKMMAKIADSVKASQIDRS